MDDLISRKAALEAIKIPDGAYSNPPERHGIIIGRVEARRNINSLPSVPAVPLDKLCEWLAEYCINIPCETCRHFSYDYCTAIGDMDKPCPNKAEDWQRVIKGWMEEQDAAD